MYVIHKLKPDRNFLILLLPFGSLVVAAFLALTVGIEWIFRFFTMLFWVYASYTLITLVRTHNTGFIIVALFQFSAGAFTFAAPQAIANRGEMKPLMLFLISLEVFFFIWVVILALTKKLKWRGREILELAALPIEEVGSGYTARPLPAGKTEFTQRQILEFAEFVRRNLIAVPYLGKDKAVFVPVMAGREIPFILGLKSDYTDETRVAFDYSGKVSVNITHRDYLEYKESLAFDQLCESLSDLFVEFMDLFHRGEGLRIIDRMNAVGISVFS